MVTGCPDPHPPDLPLQGPSLPPSLWGAHLYHVGFRWHGEFLAVDFEGDVRQAADGAAADLRWGRGQRPPQRSRVSRGDQQPVGFGHRRGHRAPRVPNSPVLPARLTSPSELAPRAL